MLYRAYSNPMDLVKRYISTGRFGTFVSSFLQAEYDRRKAEAEKDNENKLWLAYVHVASKGLTDKSFDDWKKDVLRSGSTTGSKDAELTADGARSIVNKLLARNRPKE